MDPRSLEEKMSELFKEAKKQNLYPAIEGLADVFQLPTSFVMFDNSTISTITEIPLRTRSSTMTLHRLAYARIITATHHVKVPHEDLPLLAVSDDGKWYRELSETELLECDRIRDTYYCCLLYTSPSPRDKRQSRMPSSA